MRDKGYNIRERTGPRGTSYTVEIWDPRVRRYGLRETFAQRKHAGDKRAAERAAIKYGKDQAAAIRARVKTLQQSGGCPTAEALEHYIDHLTHRGANPTHLANIRRRLGSLHRFAPDLAATGVSKQLYAWWTTWCNEPSQIGGRPGAKLKKTTTGKPKSDRTKNNGLGDMKAFVNWCRKAADLTGLRDTIDLEWIQPIRTEQKVKPIFTIEELRTCLRMKGDPYRIRFAVGVYLGARFMEMKALRWEDIQGGYVILRGKGRKERLTPMQPELTALLRLHRRSGDHGGKWVMPEEVRRMDSGNGSKRFDSFLERAGVPKAGRSFHSLRHCYAGLMTATGEPTSLLQQYMGHSQSDMTMHYSQLALRYRQEVDGWQRGRLSLLKGAAQG